MTEEHSPPSICAFDYIQTDTTSYDEEIPFHPPHRYPEYPFRDVGKNVIYNDFRELLIKCGLDRSNVGTSSWNPLGAWIRPGQHVLIKPNLVIDGSWTSSEQLRATVVHGAFLRPIIDYCIIALRGSGQITIADGPIDLADFERTSIETGIKGVVEWYASEGINIRLVDLRPERLRRLVRLRIGRMQLALLLAQPLRGDPRGYRWVDMGQFSSFNRLPIESLRRLRSTQLVRSRRGPSKIHTAEHHLYPIAQTALDADCIISVAKLKTHKKLGVTLTMKNMVGVVAPRYWLPHYREGVPPYGDEYVPTMSLRKILSSRLHERLYVPGIFRALLTTDEIVSGRSGSWQGNDTMWRVAHDLCKCLLFSDKRGRVSSRTQRTFLSIIDGIVGGEYDGPLNPTPRPYGIIALGDNPVAIDDGCIRLMGYNPKRIPLISEIERDSLLSRFFHYHIDIQPGHIKSPFTPPPGWARLLHDRHIREDD